MIVTWRYRTSKGLVCQKEEIKCNDIIKQYNSVEVLIILQKQADIKEHNSNWPETPDHRYRIVTVGGSESCKTNALLNVINHEPDFEKMYLYTKDPCEAKYQLLIIKWESTGIKYSNDSKAFIMYSIDMYDVYKNIEEYNPNKKRKMLIVFDDMINDMFSNKNLNPIVTELFFGGSKYFSCFYYTIFTCCYEKY